MLYWNIFVSFWVLVFVISQNSSVCLHFPVLQVFSGCVSPFWVASSVHKALILSCVFQILNLNIFLDLLLKCHFRFA